MTKANFGVVGMAVMGRNLALNIESRGYTVAIYNRSKENRKLRKLNRKTTSYHAHGSSRTWYRRNYPSTSSTFG